MNPQDSVKGGDSVAAEGARLLPIVENTTEGALPVPSVGAPNDGDNPSMPTILAFANGPDVRANYVSPKGGQ